MAQLFDQTRVVQLRVALKEHFKWEELETFCFDEEIPFDDLSGEGLAARARNVVAWCKRNGCLEKLEAAIVAARPSVVFPWSVPEATNASSRAVLVAHAPGDEAHGATVAGAVRGAGYEALAERIPLRLAWREG